MTDTTARVPIADPALDSLAQKAQAQRKVPAAVETKLVTDLRGERSAGRAWVMVFSSEGGIGEYRKFVDEIFALDGELLASRIPRVSGKTRAELEKILQSLESKERMQIAEAEISKLTGDLVSTRPWLVVENFEDSKPQQPEISCDARAQGLPYMAVNLDVERDVLEMAGEDERTFREEYLRSMGFAESQIPTIVRKFPALLSQGVFYTVGEVEARAWLYGKGMKIVDASAAIHSDFPGKFLHADVTKVAEYLLNGRRARSAQKGREYELEDGRDIVDFKLKK